MGWSASKQFILNLSISVLTLLSAYCVYDYNSHNCTLKYRYLRYCNIDHFPKGNEGSYGDSADKKELQMTIFRHGDRSYSNGDNYNIEQLIPILNIRCGINSFISTKIIHEKIKDLEKWLRNFGHIKIYTNNSHSMDHLDTLPYNFTEKCEAGALTPRGFVQMFYLGEFFDKKYKSHTQHGRYSIFLRTTNKKRTQLSGFAFIAGLVNSTYPELVSTMNIPNIHVTIIDDETGLLLSNPITGRPISCDRLLKKWDNFSMNFSSTDENINLYREITSSSMLKKLFIKNSLDNFKSLTRLTDRLYVMHCHHRTNITEILNGKISQKMQTKLIRISDFIHKSMHIHMDPEVEIRMIMLNFFRNVEITQSINDISKGYLPIYVDSTHDTTILPLILALKLPDSYHHWPYYASRITFEIWEHNDPNLDITVRILLNGIDVSCESELCAESCRSHNNQCLYNTFKDNYTKGKKYYELIQDFFDIHC